MVYITQVPATINSYLREYQRDGVRFLYRHYCNGQGAILADDMGLGKKKLGAQLMQNFLFYVFASHEDTFCISEGSMFVIIVTIYHF